MPEQAETHQAKEGFSFDTDLMLEECNESESIIDFNLGDTVKLLSICNMAIEDEPFGHRENFRGFVKKLDKSYNPINVAEQTHYYIFSPYYNAEIVLVVDRHTQYRESNQAKECKILLTEKVKK